jgi:arsenite methyltransferase
VSTPDLDHPDFAEFYDELPLWSAPFAQRLLERAPLARGATILDVGCGTGFLAIELAQRCGSDAKVYAIDPWPAVMARLQRKLAYHGISNVELVQRGAEATGLSDGLADLIVSNLGVNNFADPAGVLAECLRLLRPGGRLMLTTNLAGHMAEAYAALSEVLAALGLQHRIPELAAHQAHRGTAACTRSRLAAAGFTNIAHEETSYPMRFADGTAMLGHWLMRIAFVPDWLRVTGDDPQILPALETRLNAVARQAGGLSLTIPVALFEAMRARTARWALVAVVTARPDRQKLIVSGCHRVGLSGGSASTLRTESRRTVRDSRRNAYDSPSMR